MRTISSVKQLAEFMRDASPGDRAVYHRGALCHDRHQRIFTRPDGQSVYAVIEAVDTLAEAVMIAYDHGFVIPTQKRLGDGDYLYFVTRRTER